MRRRPVISGLVLLILVGGPLMAHAQSLKARKVQHGEEQVLAEEVSYTNQVCETDIEASVDWSSIQPDALVQGERPSASCDVVLGAIESLCVDESRKREIRKRVGRVVCAKGESRSVSLKEGTLFFQFRGSAGDDFRYIRDYLTRKIAASDDE